MDLKRKAAFSYDNKYFAHFGEKGDLLILETDSKKFIKCKFDWNLNTCSSIRWIPIQYKHNSPKKAKLRQNFPFECTLLAIGTVKGDILLYNIDNENIFSHLVGRHHGAINDICFYPKNNSFFTCSSDQHIAIWDILSGKQISKWKADENSIASICVIDDKNLLSSSTSILWWNVPEKTVLKKFSGHSTEIFKLLPVNADSINSCYFLSFAVDDTKIHAWSLNSSDCEKPVASFSLPLQPKDVDISKVSSKDKPLVLSALTKDGYLHLFEHTLNGNISQAVQSKVSVKINSECKDFSVLSVRLNDDSSSCIIAYGSSISDIAFKHVKIKELLLKGEMRNTISENIQSTSNLSLVGNSSKTERNPPVNGLTDSVLHGYKKKLRSSAKSSTVPDSSNPSEKEILAESQLADRQVLDDPVTAVSVLLDAIKIQNDNIIEAIFRNNDAEYIASFVKCLSTSNLKIVLDELNQRLLKKYSTTLCRWLKEILKVHLRYLSQCDDAVESLSQARAHLSSMKISETLHKMTVLQGLLNLQMQDSSSSESDSENEELMEL